VVGGVWFSLASSPPPDRARVSIRESRRSRLLQARGEVIWGLTHRILQGLMALDLAWLRRRRTHSERRTRPTGLPPGRGEGRQADDSASGRGAGSLASTCRGRRATGRRTRRAERGGARQPGAVHGRSAAGSQTKRISSSPQARPRTRASARRRALRRQSGQLDRVDRRARLRAATRAAPRAESRRRSARLTAGREKSSSKSARSRRRLAGRDAVGQGGELHLGQIEAAVRYWTALVQKRS